ncbi:MAG: hypothetical protein JWO53_652 [Chlamydiia bacterium]|nr:hypothetical protein [Chlamydiia bacterium]
MSSSYDAANVPKTDATSPVSGARPLTPPPITEGGLITPGGNSLKANNPPTKGSGAEGSGENVNQVASQKFAAQAETAKEREASEYTTWEKFEESMPQTRNRRGLEGELSRPDTDVKSLTRTDINKKKTEIMKSTELAARISGHSVTKKLPVNAEKTTGVVARLVSNIESREQFPEITKKVLNAEQLKEQISRLTEDVAQHAKLLDDAATSRETLHEEVAEHRSAIVRNEGLVTAKLLSQPDCEEQRKQLQKEISKKTGKAKEFDGQAKTLSKVIREMNTRLKELRTQLTEQNSHVSTSAKNSAQIRSESQAPKPTSAIKQQPAASVAPLSQAKVDAPKTKPVEKQATKPLKFTEEITSKQNLIKKIESNLVDRFKFREKLSELKTELKSLQKLQSEFQKQGFNEVEMDAAHLIINQLKSMDPKEMTPEQLDLFFKKLEASGLSTQLKSSNFDAGLTIGKILHKGFTTIIEKALNAAQVKNFTPELLIHWTIIAHTPGSSGANSDSMNTLAEILLKKFGVGDILKTLSKEKDDYKGVLGGENFYALEKCLSTTKQLNDTGYSQEVSYKLAVHLNKAKKIALDPSKTEQLNTTFDAITDILKEQLPPKGAPRAEIKKMLDPLLEQLGSNASKLVGYALEQQIPKEDPKGFLRGEPVAIRLYTAFMDKRVGIGLTENVLQPLYRSAASSSIGKLSSLPPQSQEFTTAEKQAVGITKSAFSSIHTEVVKMSNDPEVRTINEKLYAATEKYFTQYLSDPVKGADTAKRMITAQLFLRFITPPIHEHMLKTLKSNKDASRNLMVMEKTLQNLGNLAATGTDADSKEAYMKFSRDFTRDNRATILGLADSLNGMKPK